eukprot:GHRR01012033.1.p2 GENE.GHRR01012033.1~~GHRR01012033.1.p2  ORF type:complete len:147 (+),score=32.79 GHRR01012033.1:900-1340(+)
MPEQTIALQQLGTHCMQRPEWHSSVDAQSASIQQLAKHCNVFAGARESGPTYLTLLPIAGGVVIASGGEPLFNLLGFSACLLATSGRALKSVVQVSSSWFDTPTRGIPHLWPSCGQEHSMRLFRLALMDMQFTSTALHHCNACHLG